MNPAVLKVIRRPDSFSFDELLDADPGRPHVHLVDMPFRATSTWQDRGCELGVWEKGGRTLAWAVFQPPWRNLDFAIAPSEQGSSLEDDLFAWGKAQMAAYARRTGEAFNGCVEFFDAMPGVEQRAKRLRALGFEQLDWSTFRFELDLRREFAQSWLSAEYHIRPSRGKVEIQGHVDLVQAVFGPGWMPREWRERILAHPAYRPEIDLVVADAQNTPVGFCACWLRGDVGQIEPLGVHPAHQGKGLGRALELAACEALQKQGARLLYVDHGSTNEKAIALSLKTGFRQRKNALRYYVSIGA